MVEALLAKGDRLAGQRLAEKGNSKQREGSCFSVTEDKIELSECTNT